MRSWNELPLISSRPSVSSGHRQQREYTVTWSIIIVDIIVIIRPALPAVASFSRYRTHFRSRDREDGTWLMTSSSFNSSQSFGIRLLYIRAAASIYSSADTYRQAWRQTKEQTDRRTSRQTYVSGTLTTVNALHYYSTEQRASSRPRETLAITLINIQHALAQH